MDVNYLPTFRWVGFTLSYIKEIKREEVSEIYDFLQGIEDYGHIYHFPPEALDSPFKKIMEGIEEVEKMMKDSFEM